MLSYNTQQPRLVLPEYGRTIQNMVNHCLTLEDRNERTRCAHAIVDAMGRLFPNMRQSEDLRRTLWDHIAIMADFKLDIDFPYEPPKPDNLATKPEKVPYGGNSISLRHYGSHIERMLRKAAEMEPGDERDALVLLLANHLKKSMLAVNKDGVDDARIFNDIARYTHGAIIIDPATHRLHEFKEAPQPAGKKKKKK